MVRKAFALIFALTVLFSSIAGLMLVEITTANNPGSWFPQEHYPTITINNDGSITPQTDLISREGNTYTLTANVTTYMIFIDCSNIVFDGGGYTIDLWNETDPAISVGQGPVGVRNVTIKNVEVNSYSEAIQLSYCSHCQITNVKVNSDIQLELSNHTSISQCIGPIKIGWGSSDNQVFRSNITRLTVSSQTMSNIFYENNFLCDAQFVAADCFWDNGQVGNYWVAYNGTDSNGDGIGDISYIVNGDNIDHYPLMYPYDIENDKLILTAQGLVNEPVPLVLVAGVSVLSVAAALMGLKYYQKKSRRLEKQ
jgi:hypothetical protein